MLGVVFASIGASPSAHLERLDLSPAGGRAFVCLGTSDRRGNYGRVRKANRNLVLADAARLVGFLRRAGPARHVGPQRRWRTKAPAPLERHTPRPAFLLSGEPRDADLGVLRQIGLEHRHSSV